MLQKIKAFFVVDTLEEAIFFHRIAWIPFLLGGFVFLWWEGMAKIPLGIGLWVIWIFLDRKYQCPICHKQLQETRTFRIPTYCPHCGAKLKE